MTQATFDNLLDELADRMMKRLEPRITALVAERERGDGIRPSVLTTRQAAGYCGIDQQSMYNLIHRGEGPVHFKHGQRNAFYSADLDDWLTARLVRAS